MRKLCVMLFSILVVTSALAAADNTNQTSGPAYSIFSTSTDWQALTGLRYNEYHGRFIPDKKIIGRQGLILYYLDGFPCYGLGFGVRVWLGPNGNHDDARLQIACVYPPTTVKFAWRNAPRDATQAASTGLMTCPVTTDDRELVIDLSRCTQESGWSQYQ